MPIYEFQCDDCEQIYDALLRFSDVVDAPRCPTCGSQNTRRLLSRIAAPSFGGGDSSAASSCGGGGGRFT